MENYNNFTSDSAGDRRTVLTPSDPSAVESLDVQMESGVGLTVLAVNRTLAVTVFLPDRYNVRKLT